VLIFTSAVLLTTAATAQQSNCYTDGRCINTTAGTIYVPSIKWHVRGPIEWLFNKIGGSSTPDERNWEILPTEHSLAACEAAVDAIVKDWDAVKSWKCTVYTR
jgi:hypothetical protein